jgi:HTH-type transcriptional regulator/antitoxin HigA
MNETRIRPIRTDEDHAGALSRIEELMDAKEGTPEFDELVVLAQLAELYEDQRWPMGMPSPVAAIKFRMEQGELTRRDLEPYIGSSGKVSEVLSGKLPLTLKMIRALHKHLGIPAEVLLGDPTAQLEQDELAEDCDKYPLAEMQAKLKTFSNFSTGAFNAKERCEEALRWLVQKVGIQPRGLAAFCRKNDESRENAKMDGYAFRGWCLHVLAKAVDNPLPHAYEPGSVTPEFLRQIATLSSLPNGPLIARDALAQLGIHLVIAEHLKQTYLDGAAMLLPDGTPVIALTLRYNRLDNFWHNLLHELVHVKNDLSSTRGIIYDDFTLPSAGSTIEQRADEEAAEALVPHVFLPDPIEMGIMNTEQLQVIARRARVHPAVVAGRIRHITQDWRKFARIVSAGDVRQQFAD